MINKSFAAVLAVAFAMQAAATEHIHTVDTIMHGQIGEVQVTARRASVRRMVGAQSGIVIDRPELFKAACCNLGESFVTNPSVDVSYNDATTGARQIKLLGLSGTYVQMLTETMPDFRGAAAPYALGYVPGPWMQSIQVSKGSASVKNGYESITGQINVEYKKPEDEQGAEVNLYGNSMGRIEANVDANWHITDGLSTELLLHHENRLSDHDSDHDGFMDSPTVEQYNVQNRWLWQQGNYLLHAGLTALKENRTSGQMHSGDVENPFLISLKTHRYSAYAKNALILNHDRGTNIALLASASMHKLDAKYGLKAYDVNQKNVYASLMFETNFAEMHNLSLGLSLNHDYLGQDARIVGSAGVPMSEMDEKETTTGAYAQYTLNLSHHLTAMAGVRVDHSSLYGTFVTPRFHFKWAPCDVVSVRASAGKGYRTVHALAEYNYLLASGRTLLIDDLEQERAWNYGLSAAFNIPLWGRLLKVNAEYYFTHFGNQAVVDYDSDQAMIHVCNLAGKSYSHTVQVDATIDVFKGMAVTAAWRYNDVKSTYGGVLRSKPLTSRYKSLLTASYKTPLGLWQFDATLQLNGGGRLPDPYTLPDGSLSWQRRFHAYEQLSVQVTRWFRHWAVYVGGENLTGFKQRHPIISVDDPWSSSFEPTLVWGPMEGAVIYAGVRINIGRNSF